MNYFNKFPLISYNGQTAVNLLSRAGLPSRYKNNKTIFYDYITEDEDRIDSLSNDYYDKPGFTWLIWYANNTQDPYYDLAISDNEVFSHVVAKYGSIEAAQRKIAFYRVNWYGDQTRLSRSQFEDIPTRQKKYWSPYTDQYGNIAGYARNQMEISANTNRIVTIKFEGSAFTKGEKVYVNSSTYGYCTYSDSTAVTIQHITGDFESDLTSATITGDESGVTNTVTSCVVVSSTDAWTDASYWEPVTYFNYEMESNENKRNIKLINNMHSVQIENELRRVLKQT